jgi:hypothetical protein
LCARFEKELGTAQAKQRAYAYERHCLELHEEGYAVYKYNIDRDEVFWTFNGIYFKRDPAVPEMEYKGSKVAPIAWLREHGNPA